MTTYVVHMVQHRYWDVTVDAEDEAEAIDLVHQVWDENVEPDDTEWDYPNVDAASERSADA